MPPRSRSSPPPPPPSSRPAHERRRGPRSADLPLDAAAIDAALAPILPDARGRAFVLRCILHEGPRHHRVASWALLRLLSAVLDQLGGAEPSTSQEISRPVAMRLPPSVAAATEDAEFPLGLPTRMIEEVIGGADAALAIECLGSGPPHHALANAAMTSLLQAIYDRLEERGSRMTGSE